ncbi:hypothetical protein HDU93_002285 [Gonapodya sp. JEL0774]|nr:hypothetical protein HDU93_002285 [Gonapodya sp. JEL0774]
MNVDHGTTSSPVASRAHLKHAQDLQESVVSDKGTRSESVESSSRNTRAEIKAKEQEEEKSWTANASGVHASKIETVPLDHAATQHAVDSEGPAGRSTLESPLVLRSAIEPPSNQPILHEATKPLRTAILPHPSPASVRPSSTSSHPVRPFETTASDLASVASNRSSHSRQASASQSTSASLPGTTSSRSPSRTANPLTGAAAASPTASITSVESSHSRSPSRASAHHAITFSASSTSPSAPSPLSERKSSTKSATSLVSPSPHSIAAASSPLSLSNTKRGAAAASFAVAGHERHSSAGPGSHHTRHGSWAATPSSASASGRVVIPGAPSPLSSDITEHMPPMPKQDPHVYPATPWQVDLYRTVYPGTEDPAEMRVARRPGVGVVDEDPPYITQCYLTSTSAAQPYRVTASAMRKAVEVMISRYPVLGAKVWSNPRILDSDILCEETRDIGKFVTGEDGGLGVVEEVTGDRMEGGASGVLSTTAVSELVRRWMRRQVVEAGTKGADGKKIGTLKVFVFSGGGAAPWRRCVVGGIKDGLMHGKEIAGIGTEWTVAVFAFSQMVADERSAGEAAREVMEYARAVVGGFALPSTTNPVPPGTEAKSYASYARDVAVKAASKFHERGLPSFLRQQCFEVVQETHIASSQRKGVELKRTQLLTQVDVLSKQRDSLLLRKRDLDLELATLREQRLRMDDLFNSSDVTTLYDTTSGEMIRITVEAKRALLRAVLGPDVEIGDAESLLVKHGVSEKARKAVGVKDMSIEEFAKLDEVEMEYMVDLSSKEKKRILALVSELWRG